jgi:hypothetical protein
MVTPPAALISSIASFIPLSASHPYRNAVDNGAPITMGGSAEFDATQKNEKTNSKTTNDTSTLLMVTPFS